MAMSASSEGLPRWSGPAWGAVGLYAGAAVVAMFEIVALWLALHPNVNADYRDYFLDKTTTCLNRQVPGTTVMGVRISFASQGYGIGEDDRVCGWEGPAGDGLHSVGEESRLRFEFGTASPPASLSLAMTGVGIPGHPVQHIVLKANGIRIGVATLPAYATDSFSFIIPPAVFAAGDKVLDLTLEYPDAIRMGPTDADTRKRAIKLLWVKLD